MSLPHIITKEIEVDSRIEEIQNSGGDDGGANGEIAYVDFITTVPLTIEPEDMIVVSTDVVGNNKSIKILEKTDAIYSHKVSLGSKVVGGTIAITIRNTQELGWYTGTTRMRLPGGSYEDLCVMVFAEPSDTIDIPSGTVIAKGIIIS